MPMGAPPLTRRSRRAAPTGEVLFYGWRELRYVDGGFHREGLRLGGKPTGKPHDLHDPAPPYRARDAGRPAPPAQIRKELRCH